MNSFLARASSIAITSGNNSLSSLPKFSAGWYVVEAKDDAWGPFETEQQAKDAAVKRSTKRVPIKYGRVDPNTFLFKPLPAPKK